MEEECKKYNVFITVRIVFPNQVVFLVRQKRSFPDYRPIRSGSPHCSHPW